MTIRYARGLISLGFLGLAAGCSAASDGGIDEALPAPSPSPPSTRGTIPFRTRNGGVKQVAVEVRNGRAYVGDMGFGSIDDMRPRSASLQDLDDRWPEGKIPFCFDSSGLSNEVKDNVVEAMEYLERRVPGIDFIEKEDCGLGILFVHSSGEAGSTSRASVGFSNGADIELGLDAGTGVIRHELGHTLGLRHEQVRFDRNTYVEVCPINIQGDHIDNWDIEDSDDIDLLTPYDYHSVMHYGPELFLSNGPIPLSCDGKTMRAKQDTFPETESTVDTTFGTMGHYTRHDINSLNLMYGRGLGTPQIGDRFGGAMAVADFDADGYDDVVVGAPHDHPDLPGRSALFFYKGTQRGLTPMRVIVPVLAENQVGDMLGASFAVGDFDGDGFPDLAVGAPGAAAPGQSTRAGLVRVYFGGQWSNANYVANCAADPKCVGSPTDGPLVRTVVLQPSLVTSGLTGTSGFGTALAAGDFSGDGRVDLVVGAPGMAGGRGRAFLYRQRTPSSTGGVGLDPSGATELVPTTLPDNTARFGSSLAGGDFDGDGRRDLAIGAPSNATGAGKVYRFNGYGTGLSYRQTITSTVEKGALFGSSLATGRIREFTGGVDLVVGAPAEKNAGGTKAGAVHLLEWQPGTGPLPISTLGEVQVVRSGSSSEEHFGQALVAVNVDLGNYVSLQEVIVGAPTGANGGRIVVLKKNAAGSLANVQVVTSTAVGFGSSFGVGLIENKPPIALPPDHVRLLVGAPHALTDLIPFAGLVLGYDFVDGSVTGLTALTQTTGSFWAAP